MAVIHNNRIGTGIRIKSVILANIGVLCSLICISTQKQDGLQLLFLLPLSFSANYLLFGRVYSYWKDSIGIAILLLSIFVRYLAIPVLMALSGTALKTLNPNASSLRIATLIQIVELFAVNIIIDIVWTKYKKKYRYLENEKKTTSFRLSFLGFLFLVVLAGMIYARGHMTSVFSNLSTWWNITKGNSPLYTYDLVAFEVIKSVIIISIIAWISKVYHRVSDKSMQQVLFAFAVAMAFANTIYFQYEARTALAQLLFSTVFMLLSFFPDKKKTGGALLSLCGVAAVAFIFFEGSMNYSGDEGVGGRNMVYNLAKMAELYVSGPSVVAKCLDTYGFVRASMSIETVWADLISSMHFFGMIPFFRFISNSVSAITITNQLFVDSLGGLTYIMPNFSYCTYYVSIFFAWLLELVIIYIIIKLLTVTNKLKKQTSDGCMYYAVIYIEILLGQAIFVNNYFLFWHAFTNLPFWLLSFSAVNRFGNRIKLKKEIFK